MTKQDASAQLVTSFDPGMAPSAQTSIGHALAQWTALGDAARAEALLIVQETGDDRLRVFGRLAITQLIADGAMRPA